MHAQGDVPSDTGIAGMSGMPSHRTSVPIAHAAVPWTDRHEVVLRSLGERMLTRARLHERAGVRYDRLDTAYALPVIFLSTLASAASFATSFAPVEVRDYSSLFIGCISTAVGLIQTLRQFARVSESLSGHRLAAAQFSLQARHIGTQLSVERAERSQCGVDAIRDANSEYDKAVEKAPIVPIGIKREYVQAIRKSKAADEELEELGVSLPDDLFGVQRLRIAMWEDSGHVGRRCSDGAIVGAGGGAAKGSEGEGAGAGEAV